MKKGSVAMRPRFVLIAAALIIPSALAAQRGGGAGAQTMLSATADDPFAALRFRAIGPAFTTGRVSDIAVDPNNKYTWYLATAAAGVWKTTNAGLSFTPVFDGYGSYSTCCILVDPKNSSTVWLGTGENTNSRSAMAGDGVYKSINAGVTWTRMGLEHSQKIGRMAIDPSNSEIVYVAAQGSLWGPGGERGLYKTVDGGKTWKAVLQISENTGVTDVVLDPRNPQVIYAASYQRRRNVGVLIGGGPESGIFKSTDGGTSFSKLTNGLPTVDIGRIALGISPQNPDVVYAMVTAQSKNSGIFRSADRGVTWVKQSDWASNDPQYYGEMAMNPFHLDAFCMVDISIECTIDGGKTFQRQNWSVHTDHHLVAFDPTDSLHLFNGNDGGLYETVDGGATWRHFASLPITQFYRVSVDNALPFYNVFGGAQDNGTLGIPSRSQNPLGIRVSEALTVGGGDGMWTQVDPTDPNTVYVSSQNGAMSRLDRRTGASRGIQPPKLDALGKPTRTAFEVPYIISPHNHHRLYVLENVLFRSDNRGDAYTTISGDLTRQINRDTLTIMGRQWGADAVTRNVFTNDLGVGTALNESSLKEGLLYVGTDDGLIQVSEDGAKTWRKVESFPGVPAQTYVSEVLPSQIDTNVVYASFNGQWYNDFTPYLLKSTDRGRTWKSIRANLSDGDQIWTLAEDPGNRNILFVGTEHGISVTLDGGQSWQRMKSGLPTIAVRSIRLQSRENDLVIGTFGRGIYIVDDYTPLRLLATPNSGRATASAEGVLAAPRATRVYVETPFQRAGNGPEVFTAQNPPFGALLSYTLASAAPAGEGIVITVKDAGGKEIAQVVGPTTAGLNRTVWNLRSAPTPPPAAAAPARADTAGGGAGGAGAGAGATGAGRGAASGAAAAAAGGATGAGRGGGRGGAPGPLVSPAAYTLQLNRRVGTVLTPIGSAQRLQVTP